MPCDIKFSSCAHKNNQFCVWSWDLLHWQFSVVKHSFIRHSFSKFMIILELFQSYSLYSFICMTHTAFFISMHLYYQQTETNSLTDFRYICFTIKYWNNYLSFQQQRFEKRFFLFFFFSFSFSFIYLFQEYVGHPLVILVSFLLESN